MSPEPLVVTEKNSVQDALLYLVAPWFFIIGGIWLIVSGEGGTYRGVPIVLAAPVAVMMSSAFFVMGVRSYWSGRRVMVADNYGMSGCGLLSRNWQVPWQEIVAVYPILERGGPKQMVVVTTRPPSSGMLDRITGFAVSLDTPRDRECKIVDWSIETSMDMRTALRILQQRVPRHVRVTVY